jgi:flagellin-like protein
MIYAACGTFGMHIRFIRLIKRKANICRIRKKGVEEGKMRSLSISIARSRKAVSPVIATIIIVAIAISIAIAVAYWMVGITGAFTRFEKLEVVSAYATAYSNDTYTGYKIKITLKNTGTTDTTINLIFINGKPAQDYTKVGLYNETAETWWNLDNLNIPARMGSTISLEVYLPDTFKPGQSVEITLHTAGGKDYPKNVVLP